MRGVALKSYDRPLTVVDLKDIVERATEHSVPNHWRLLMSEGQQVNVGFTDAKETK